MNEEMTKSEEQHLSLQKALQQCELVQNMIDISISSLEGLRTKCATSNDLTQKEIRTLEGKLVKYFSRQLSCKCKVALEERSAELEDFPRLGHWFRIVNLRKEVTQEMSPGEVTLEGLLEMSEEQVCELLQKFGASEEECARLNASLSCLRKAHQLEQLEEDKLHNNGGSQTKQDWSIQWPTSESGKENTPVCQPEASQWIRFQLSQSPKVQSKYNQHMCHSPQALAPPLYADRLTVDSPSSGLFPPLDSGHRSLPPSPRQRHFGHTPPRTHLVVNTMTPPGTPPMRRRNKVKAPGTPPPPSRKLIHLLPGFTALHRSKSHEFQLGNRLDDTQTPKAKKKTKPLNLKIHSSVGSCENLPTQRSPLHTERSLRSFFFPSFIPSTPPVHAETPSANTLSVPRWSPQIPRRDLGNSIKHRFSTKYWMSQTCIVCGKGMLFGLKCKNCKLKCHNKCTKEAPPCHLLIIQRGGRESLKDHQGTTQVARLVRTESVPCDINNPLRYTDLHISQTLPKTNKINKDHIPVPYQPDSSSNPSSTTSSTPSSPAPPLPSSATPPSPLHPSPQSARQQKQFNLTASSYFKYKQQFIFPDVAPEAPPSRAPQVILHPVLSEPGNEGNPLLQIEVEPTSDNEEGNDEDSGDEFEEMNLSLLSARNFPRKASQTSIFLQEWDIPFEQLEIGEMIGKGRFGKVFHGRWHGEVAIRLIDIERDNEDQLKAFKREVMAYRNTRHENVVLFMGACMSPPHLAIITSFCKGRTLYSVVRDAKVVLDVNKTRQIAQEMVKGMGYLHAKGILHKDMKSKNVFYDNGKVVITDFGLFTISGVLQAGSRREDKLRIPNGWLCHLAPEIIQQLSPETEEDKLPFSKQSDVFAFGTIWYELHAREWPYKSQPAEVIIWQIGSGMKPNLAQTGMGKEILDILLLCWAYKPEERPSFSKLVDLLEKLPKRNRRLSHPGHFWKSAEYVK
ncbi:kinase suppressor of Ras 2 isoform X1 [Maylandia zebra]|uniref:non-specific serine/threonine protein kinase n=3 Tax=Haplochromini TaxID=319058 RepID=A0A9Y6JFD0_9CICH|nr:kinase suppressor of Ras 2 isoform X1 [Haplochromis burtoni]XP_013768803.1 PREDICTED: kinase suppressor of Ras 2 isoform X1 [Pundamilia nyererei]XP_024654880.1 kinase suppressor of Ras 2 isoform X1 [Maylandia zebra]XP_024660117.1 kinase suppressor of Ras 2 isoform X1 [Maylandia zebra]XP_026043717.1 kinase suppressor of Ras 2 isoform X1 [Astatotilapia calliptera]XP_039906564.1 kinase suppressor of Ras 2 isoform X1 [Simochromis diagramma]